MGKFFETIPDDDVRNWILEQKIYFVASAPLSGKGHINVSPKGRLAINLVGDNACWYTDMSGSGNETLSHIYEANNGRITIMFVAFTGPPRIVRLFGTGKVYERGTPEFSKLLPNGDERILPGTRAIIWIDIHQVGTSCGFSVPYFDYTGERLILDEFYQKHEVSEQDEQGIPVKLRDYWNLKNSYSIDHLPGLYNATDKSQTLPTPFDLSKESSQLAQTAAKDTATHIIYEKATFAKLMLAVWIFGFGAGIMGLRAVNTLRQQTTWLV